MKYTIARINDIGMAQIADALGQYHKARHFTQAMLAAWAEAAEDSFNNGSGCYFEIPGFDSNIGCPVEVTITDAGFDLETVEA